MRDYMKHRFYQKNIAWLYLIILVFATVTSLIIPQQEMAKASDPLVIPGEAIRLRILANSDGETDQEVKRAIRDAVNAEITNWVQDLTSIDTARTTITSRLDHVEEIAKKELAARNLDYSVKVEFGNVQFPTKLYGQYLYPAGTYEAILVTLGKGKGANWWCVLFPPLCFLDFSNSLAVSPGFEEEANVDEEINDNEDAQENTDINIIKDIQMDKDIQKKEDNQENEDTHINGDNSTGSVDKTVDNKAEHNDKQAPTFVKEDENKVKVKFFLVELFNKLF
ncbi:stage II sporulation protein R [Lederbergia wuyishanensis]|uniref:Stage II sporulation protein R n=1 Tax=Lederbergia wuyishanensis TaxID=1347903 RepID=A0ABU0D3E5_9BACI|nr:stage II sporulation protein R [Lederbergia wuyishanensis]MCJ8007912.1 stage II sporulation protein R [Lederbergia wuyishanensis]MDQ0342921.1 stage II sporulation protein R [Lederbergia wuyishanensis]